MSTTFTVPDILGLVATVKVTEAGTHIDIALPEAAGHKDAATLRAYRDKVAAESALSEAEALGTAKGYARAKLEQDELEKKALAEGKADAERDHREILELMADSGETLDKLSDHPLAEPSVGAVRDAQRREHETLMADARRALRPKSTKGVSAGEVPVRGMRIVPSGRVVHLVVQGALNTAKLKRKPGQSLCFHQRKQGLPAVRYEAATGPECPLCFGVAQAMRNRGDLRVVLQDTSAASVQPVPA